MSIAYSCELRFRCVFVVWDGDVTPDQWTAHFKRLVNDPAFAACSRALVDLSTAGGAANITDDVIREMGTRWRGRAPEIGSMEWAIVPNGAWGRARKLERELETVPGIHTMIFDHAGTACVWLGIDVAQARLILDGLREVAGAEARTEST